MQRACMGGSAGLVRWIALMAALALSVELCLRRGCALSGGGATQCRRRSGATAGCWLTGQCKEAWVAPAGLVQPGWGGMQQMAGSALHRLCRKYGRQADLRAPARSQQLQGSAGVCEGCGQLFIADLDIIWTHLLSCKHLGGIGRGRKLHCYLLSIAPLRTGRGAWSEMLCTR